MKFNGNDLSNVFVYSKLLYICFYKEFGLDKDKGLQILYYKVVCNYLGNVIS